MHPSTLNAIGKKRKEKIHNFRDEREKKDGDYGEKKDSDYEDYG